MGKNNKTIISAKQLDDLSNKAKTSARLRKNFNYHPLLSDPINRMLNAFEPNTYCRPHKHKSPDKREVFIVLKGKLGVVLFDELGNITDGIVLAPYPGNPGIEIPPGVWHMALALQEGTVAYEIKDGPYNENDDKNFASWAPEEGSELSKRYLKDLMTRAKFTK